MSLKQRLILSTTLQIRTKSRAKPALFVELNQCFWADHENQSLFMTTLTKTFHRRIIMISIDFPLKQSCHSPVLVFIVWSQSHRPTCCLLISVGLSPVFTSAHLRLTLYCLLQALLLSGRCLVFAPMKRFIIRHQPRYTLHCSPHGVFSRTISATMHLL